MTIQQILDEFDKDWARTHGIKSTQKGDIGYETYRYFKVWLEQKLTELVESVPDTICRHEYGNCSCVEDEIQEWKDKALNK